MRIQHVLGLFAILSLSLSANAQELRPELPESAGEVKQAEEEQKAIDIVTDKVLDPSASPQPQAAPAGKPQKWQKHQPRAAAPAAEKDGGVITDSVGAVGKGAAAGVGAVGHGAAKSVEAVGHGAAAVGSGTVRGVEAVGGGVVTGAEAVGRGTVKSVEAVGGGVVTGAEAVGRGTVKSVEAVGGGVVTGAEAVGRGTARGVEAVGHGAQAVGSGTVKGVEKVGTGAVKGAEAVGRGAKQGAEALGRGAVKGAQGLGRGAKRSFEKIGDLFDRDGAKPAATSSTGETRSVAESVAPKVEVPPAPAGTTEQEAPVNSADETVPEPGADAPEGWNN